MVDDAGICRSVQQPATGLFLIVEARREAQGSAGAGVFKLARPVQIDDPQLVPDPVAGRAESGKRTLAGQCPVAQRPAHSGAGGPRDPVGSGHVV